MSEPLVASDQIDKLGSYCDRLKDAIDAIAIYPRTPLHDAFDRVALQSVSKAFGLVRSCLVLLSSGFPDEAYGSSRSLVECSANLRYLTQDRSLRDERTHQLHDISQLARATACLLANSCRSLFCCDHSGHRLVKQRP